MLCLGMLILQLDSLIVMRTFFCMVQRRNIKPMEIYAPVIDCTVDR